MRESVHDGMRRRWKPVLLVVTLALIGAGVSYASIPDASGVIHGCYTNKGGILSVIDPSAGKSCSSLQTQITWNQQGPKGDKGDAGVQGLTGDTGPQGPQGPQGPAGVSGLERVAVMSEINSDNIKEVVADCPAGKSVTGGGYFIGGPFGEILAQRSEPRFSPTGWLVTAAEIGAGTDQDWYVVVTALCVNAT